MSKKSTTQQLTSRRKRSREWRTFLRMLRYGVNNFSRNAWLTIAATAVMTITLLIVFLTVVSQVVLSDTTAELAKRIDRSIYLKTDTSSEEVAPIMQRLQAVSNVDTVTFVSSDENRADFAKQNKGDAGTLTALNEATNNFPATIKITLKNARDTSGIVTFVKNDEELKSYLDPNREPTFLGERKSATDTIADWTATIQQVGIGASVVFISISALIIFNTIRMAIFNRKEEIQMMKLIGADRSFIRGPFVVEAVVYGFIAALLASGIGVALLYASGDQIGEWGVEIAPTLQLVTNYIALVILAMIVLGALVGTISSLLATRRYLKI